MVEQLWKIFLEAGLIFLILITCYGIASFLYNITIGNKKEAKRKEQAKEELLKNLQDLAKELGSCECENNRKKANKKEK